jgi:hypothetical protein
LPEVFQSEAAQNEEIIAENVADALLDLFSMQSAIVVGLISIMTGSGLQEDIVATASVLVRKGQQILEINPQSETTWLRR